MATIDTQGIKLEDLENVFRLLGRQLGMAALEKRVANFIIENDPRIALFLKEMEKYDEPRLQGSPASDNNSQRKDRADVNYFAPKKNLQVVLCEEWFDKVSTDKKKYTTAWREKLVSDLMQSEYGERIALTWQQSDQRLKLKGRVIGALIAAGVFKEKALGIARTFYNTDKNSPEVKTLAKYMGDSRREFFTKWIKEYVERS